MDQATHNKIVSFLWGIADDVLRDLFRRGKHPDVILPALDAISLDPSAAQRRIGVERSRVTPPHAHHHIL
jgi:hypothetical protein